MQTAMVRTPYQRVSARRARHEPVRSVRAAWEALIVTAERAVRGGGGGWGMPVWRVHCARSHLLELRLEALERLLRIAEEHARVLLDEDGVVDAGVARPHRALHNDHLLRVPHFQDRHARNRRVGILLGRRVDRVVRAHDQGEVGVLEVVVDLVHLEHRVVRHARLGEQHVQLAGHAPCDGVDGEAHVDALVLAQRVQLCDHVLAVCHCEPITWHDDHLL
mmetsp:Transcript_24334/g.62746  ORF Transcript_24334/g.62746 Transcript_24334/m.62746 type:complete len:220 (-) Transcript_24334:623-1282(-)